MQRTKSSQSSVIDHENNNHLTYEKCPKMLQSMLDGEELIGDLGSENDYFLKSALNPGFQESEITNFSNVINQKSSKRRQKGPEYRVIDKYVKSKKQYWKERNRRKKAWELSGEGLTYKQIAERLGISEKTIQRDIKKIQPYYHRLSKAYFRKLDEQRRLELNEKLEGATISQQLGILTAEWKNYEKLLKQREYNRHTLKIIIDMDDQTYGFPAIRFWPKPPISVRGRPYYFQFYAERNGERFCLGEIKLG